MFHTVSLVTLIPTIPGSSNGRFVGPVTADILRQRFELDKVLC